MDKRKKKSSTGRSSPKLPSQEVAEAETKTLRPLTLLITLIITALTLVPYIRVARYPFLTYDDLLYVFQNPHVMSGLTWGTVKWALTSLEVANWHPLTWMSHALDWQIYGPHAGGHHVTSLLLHITNALLFYFLLLRITGATWQSFFAAALFATHPLNVESVAWIAERKTLLCTFFFLLGLGAYGWYCRRPGVGRYLVVAALFLLGLASKPMVITFPFVLLLLDFWPLGRVERWTSASAQFQVLQARFSRLILEKLPLLLLCVGSAVITFVAQRNGGAVQPLQVWPLDWRIQNAIHSYAMYLCKFFFPAKLAPLYPCVMLHWWEVAWAVLFLSVCIVVIWKFHAGRPYLAIGGLWFLGTMVPVIGIVQVGKHAMADRYAYIPMMGICVAAIWGVSEAAEALLIDVGWRCTATALVLCAMALVTWRQVGYWKSSLDLWTRDLQVTRNNSIAEVSLAFNLLNDGREDEAYSHFQRALASDPDDKLALLYSGAYLARHGHYSESIARFQKSLGTGQLDAWETVVASRGLGMVYAQLGDRELARANFTRAIQTDPGDLADAQRLDQLEIQDAIEKEKLSVASHPTARGYLELAHLMQQGGFFSDAQTAYEQALLLDPRLTEAQQGMRSLKDGATRLAGR